MRGAGTDWHGLAAMAAGLLRRSVEHHQQLEAAMTLVNALNRRARDGYRHSRFAERAA
ncbi:hypothetical protein [Leisingera daeponensis]|uniref:hypothetical protein n=1 Tax=Leisingera daeponensis TaxID=405746 RepID=UPI0012B6421C|nr:hypothetical protein [Leisingera daeponensis]